MDSSELQIKTRHSLSPVTALEFVGRFLLAGEGPNLAVYNIDSNKRCFVIEVFIGATIHGLKLCHLKASLATKNHIICAFGSKSLRVINFHSDNARLAIVSPVVCLEDWIWDVVWLHMPNVPTEDNKCGASTLECNTLTDDQNTVKKKHSDYGAAVKYRTALSELCANMDSLGLACVLGHNSVCYLSLQNFDCIDHIHCEEKCILYSASCIGETWENLVVASGTVFNQVVLWKPTGPKTREGRASVYHRLDTHEGVIFSINYSPVKSMLASVSDDRSIRLWSIAPKVKTEQQTELVNGGRDVLLDHDLAELEFTEDRVLYGHAARVWDVRLLLHYIVSVGEDSTCCVWSYEGDVIQKYKGHKGKSIWSLAVAEDESIMATGGGDTSIRLWPVCKETILQSSPALTQTLQIPHMQETDADFPRVVCLNCNYVLTMTNNGVLWQYDTVVGLWAEVLREESFASYSVLSTTRITGVFAVGNIHGLLKVFVQGSVLETSVGDGKIHSIVWLQSDDLLVSANPDQLLTTGPEGALILWQVELSSESLLPLHRFILPYTKQRWVTAATFLPQSGLLICGDRGGTLHVYSTEKRDPVQSLWKLHGKTGVTDICCHGDQVYSAGRDGQYRVFLLSEGELQLLSVHKVYKGFEWIARLLVTDEGVMALGFHTDQFVAYSIWTNQKVLSIPCGGGHRAWDFVLDPRSGEYSFVYIKKQDVIACQGNLSLRHNILKESLHGREVCVVKHVFSDEDYHVVATASEDTIINLLSLTEDDTPQVLGRLQGHLSSVRALAVCQNQSLPTDRQGQQGQGRSVHKSLMFSAGGRAEIKAWCVYNNSNKKHLKTAGSETQNTSSHGLCADCDKNVEPIGDTCGSGHNAKEILKKEDDIDTTNNATAEPMCSTQTSSTEKNVSHMTSTTKRENTCWYRYLATHSLTNNMKPACKSWKVKRDISDSSDPETRYMDVSAFCVSDLCADYPSHLYIVPSACSDGFLRLLAFNEVTAKFTLLAASDFHNHCVLKVKHLILRHNNKSHVLLITAATDGKLAIWDVYDIVDAYVTYQCVTADGLYPTGGVLQAGSLSDELDFGSVIDLATPIFSLTVHQSGINSLDVIPFSDGGFLVASGGDDNMLAVSRFELTDSNPLCVQNKAKSCLESVHSAQITGVQWLQKDLLLSVSIDQRLCLWKVDIHSCQPAINLCKFINTSDVSSCDTWMSRSPGYNVVIAGVGMQYLQIL